MNRLLVMIALLFSLAALTGPAMAHAWNPGSAMTVADSVEGWCAKPAAAAKAPVFKLCAKKISGQAVQCQLPAAVLPMALEYSASHAAQDFRVVHAAPAELRLHEGWFRPPRG